MTAQELIIALQKFVQENPEAADIEVCSEGCDCYGDVQKVEYHLHTDRPMKAICLYRGSEGESMGRNDKNDQDLANWKTIDAKRKRDREEDMNAIRSVLRKSIADRLK